EKPVDIFFALLVPEEQTEGHLQTLATVAGKLSDKETIKAIRRATTSDDILSALS
ncbi:MAG: PTS sugar transporter subunit IIA, partial [Pseudomonadota bacterium]|nr:PTS sugar transporter subunit IIA [Pseudomonadota bacterium]